jgi:hypothetical protein
MCDGIRDLIQAYADMQFVAITDDNRGAVARPHQRKDKDDEYQTRRDQDRGGAR